MQDIVHRCALSRNLLDRWLAVAVAPSLIEHNFEFTKRALVHLCVDEVTEDSDDDALHEQAHSVISELMDDRLTPEQIAEFNDLLAFYRHSPGSRS